MQFKSKVTKVEIRNTMDANSYMTVALQDEGGGDFLVINTEAEAIAFDYEEWDELVRSVDILRNQ